MSMRDDISTRRSVLSAEKRALLEKRLRGQFAGTSIGQVIPQRPEQGPVPLSFAQQRLWFLDQFVPGNPFYNEHTVVRLKFPLNVAVLEQSLNEIVRRHEALRTTFATVDGKPVQVIALTHTLVLSVVDLRELPEAQREAETLRLATDEAQRPFDLAHGPLVRTTLLRLGETDYVFLLTMHHIVSDGWSLGLFSRELTELYTAFTLGQPSPLPELPIQYADFAVWQQQWLQGEVLEAQLGYWKQQLADLPVLQLPTDRPRPAVQTYRGAYQDVVLPKPLTTAFKVLSQREGVTLFMILLAAFNILLHRYTGHDDIVVGSPIANRNRAEIERLIGFFVNFLVLRTNLSGNPSFRDLLGRVREVTLNAYAHQDLPFEKLVEELKPERDMSRNPLFQVTFQLQHAPSAPQQAAGMSQPSLEIQGGTAKFDLRLDMIESPEGISARFEYSTDLFDAATIARMAGHFQTLLEGIVANPEERLSDLPLLTEAEQQQLLVAWNATKADYSKDACIHQLFEAQVKRTPEAIAVVLEDEQVTYCELNQRANQLAHYLQALGVGPETLVGICMERSVELVAGLLGILKAGGAYVPLDPEYPVERLAFMLEDAQAIVLLTQQRLVEELPGHGAQVVCLDTEWEVIGVEREENSVSGVTADNLAYVMYTSGSTGKPKGISVPHRAVNRLVLNTNYVTLDSSDRIAQASNSSFDAATFEIWGALLNGARLVGITKDVTLSPQEFSAKLRQQGITVLFVTTALFNQIAREVPGAFSLVRHLLFGGEAVDPRWVKEVLTQGPPKRLLHVYGPTETTTFASWYLVQDVPEGATTVPIGCPISNTQIYLLDRHLQPVPVGVSGELHIGGNGLACGYLNRPELTAEKFIPNPFSDKPGARLYKTGDLARYLPDGNIEFLGRIDHQVKLRGFRLELSEVEAVLAQYPAVQETVVLVREDTPGDKRLVAYVVPNQQTAPSISELRRFLQEHLPKYMIPSAFVLLDVLPMTTNGKVDRHALPAPDTARPELEEAYVAPRMPVEEVLACIWTQVLGVEQVGIHDNFFELGGDSILSIQIIARTNQAGIRITPKQLFQYQTIAELAAVADTTPLIHAEQGHVTGPVPLTPIQHWFFEQDLADPHHFNQSVLLEVRSGLDPTLLERVMQHLLVHHDALRLRFVRKASGWQQVHADPDEAVPFLRVNLSTLSESKQRTAIEATAAELQANLNLSEETLVRVALFDLGVAKPSRLLIIIHHLVVDGVSWRILLEGFQTAYQQVSRGEPIQLPPKTTSFQHWAQRLTEYAQSSAALQQELAYWPAVPSTQVTRLPVDHVRGANTVASARTVLVSLSAEETRGLLKEVPKAYNTQINDVLLTALMPAFAEWTGAQSLLFDLEGHGRETLFENVDLSRTVGWFTTIFPVLLELKTAAHSGDALKSVKEQLQRIPNRGIGYGLLRYLTGDAEIATKLRALPQAEVSFNYLGQFSQGQSESSGSQEVVRESSGPSHSLRNSRRYLLDIGGSIAGGRLQLGWTYSENVHQLSTIESLAQGFMKALRSLIVHCQSPEAGGYTPSDFSKARVSQKDLDKLITKISRSGERRSE